MRYFRYHWNETRGDDFDNWGRATYWFEMAQDGYASRQMEVYENGVVLKYDESHFSDEYGFLADQPLEPDENSIPEISAEEFEEEWKNSVAVNKRRT